MIILSFLHIIVFAILAEYLRKTVFAWSKVINNPLAGAMRGAPSGQGEAEKADAAAESKEEGEIEFKSEKVKNLHEMQEKLKEKKKEVEEQTVECEKYNNQDTYAKYAKM